MEKDTTYNGWTNYATWRINLEMFDNDMIYDYCEQHVQQCGQLPTVHNVREYLEAYIEELIEMEWYKSFLITYAQSFLNTVDYHDIAETHLRGIIEDEDIKALLKETEPLEE